MFAKGLFALLVMVAAWTAAPEQTFGQQAEEDVVYLQNGTIVRGTIVEQRPGQSLSIRTRDGSVFVFQMAEVDRIAKEPVFGGAGSARQTAAGFKEPGTATLLSVLCAGCGQIWTGETGRGATILGIGIGAPLAGAMIGAMTCDGFNCSTAPVYIGLLAAVGAWGYGIFDAAPSARRMNSSRGFAASLDTRPTVAITEAGNFQLGLQLSLP